MEADNESSINGDFDEANDVGNVNDEKNSQFSILSDVLGKSISPSKTR